MDLLLKYKAAQAQVNEAAKLEKALTEFLWEADYTQHLTQEEQNCIAEAHTAIQKLHGIHFENAKKLAQKLIKAKN